MKRFLFVFLSLVFGITLFIFVLKQVGWQETWQVLALLSWWQFLLVALVTLIGFLLAAIRWQLILKSQSGHKIPFKKILRARAVGFSLSYLTPAVYFGGEPLRAVVLKEEDGISWDKNIFSIIVDKALELTINALVILIGVIYLFTYFALPNWLNFILISVLGFSLIGFYFFYSRAFRQKGFLTTLIDFFWLNKIKKIKGMAGNIQKIEGFISVFFSRQPKYLISAVVLSLASRFFSILSAWLIVIFLDVQSACFSF
jgi:uncharacterized protein (TIRG00374 family)